MNNDKQGLTAASSRLHSLDSVRAGALLLGVLLHATLSFLPGPRLWLVADVEQSTALGLLLFVVHMLRMLTFFLLAGFVGRIAMQRLGEGAFYRDRLRRIGLPLVLGWPLLFALIVAAAILAAVIAGPENARPMPPPPTFTFTDFPLTHLWFLYVLLLMYGALALLRPVLLRLDRRGRPGWLQDGADAAVRVLLRPWGVLLLAAPLCVSFYFHPNWIWLMGIPTPDRSFIPNLPAVVAYGGAFAFGWMAQRHDAALPMWERRWRLNLLLAVGLTIVCLGIAGKATGLAPAEGGRRLAYAACYAAGAWCWALALIGMAQRFLGGYSPLRRYLADASYWIYLVHLPLVVMLQALVSRLPWPWQLKYPLIVAVAMALMLVSYAWLVRGRALGAWLNGARKPPLAR